MGDSQASEKKGGSRKSPIRDARGAVAVYVAIVAPVLFAGSQQSTCSGIPMPPFTAALSGEDMNSAGAS